MTLQKKREVANHLFYIVVTLRSRFVRTERRRKCYLKVSSLRSEQGPSPCFFSATFSRHRGWTPESPRPAAAVPPRAWTSPVRARPPSRPPGCRGGTSPRGATSTPGSTSLRRRERWRRGTTKSLAPRRGFE